MRCGLLWLRTSLGKRSREIIQAGFQIVNLNAFVMDSIQQGVVLLLIHVSFLLIVVGTQ
ncbi:hypothetical protein GRH00_003309 [Salmonella enterica subsp. salamae]|nr:hypothetical protein [Salmonella enterica subsp. salamae]